ncbi:putative helicase [Amaricoccus macauensis]|uniref:Putative helicase n=1 Tax=Amaricoccus macauensis TaxID=57001 RepID=A0A840SKG2_9RHOB|nr:type ISP restriction/modification enzyme [Amaricoccus macauensis]MBB5220376.1 putative helicase [Amaricoccus macauensis]
MSDDLLTILSNFRISARSEREKGDYFEKIVAAYLKHDAVQKQHYSEVQGFSDWARAQGRDARDTGIDLVATLADGSGFCAVQCKFYAPHHRVEKKDIDSFFTASGKAGFVRRLIIDTSDGNWSANAEDALSNQSIPTQRIGLSDLAASDIEWSAFTRTGELRTSAKRVLRPDQQDALRAVQEGLAEADRGKLIMACGTGKTFTALRIAEEMVGAGGTVLFMVPSLALMSQAVRDWTNDATVPLRSFAVCSDVKVGKRQGREDTADITIHDLAYPATTDGLKLAAQLGHASAEEVTVVFATYQSINVLTEAQAAGVGAFDLILCDEAHRTTGAKLGDEDDSNFVRIHDDANVKGLKRLYMTATPRIYGEAVKKQAEERSITLCAMDDPAIYGEVLFERGFSWAVEAGLLTDYRVIVLAMDEDQVARSVQRRLSEDNELKLDDATKIVGCYKALCKTGLTLDLRDDPAPMRRAIAFCKDIRSSKLIEGEFVRVVENFLEQDPGEDDVPALHCEVRHVDGTFNAETRTRRLDWLKHSSTEGVCRILTNARCLSEGVDVPALDAILFLHPRKSQIDVVQSVGRVMRRAEGKRMGYVILPIGIPAEQTPEQALASNERYKVVWQILNALRAHDERLDGTINQMSLGQDVSSRIEVVAVASSLPGREEKATPGIGIGSGSAAGDDQDEGSTSSSSGHGDGQGQLFVDDFAAAVRARIVKKCGTRDYWEDWAANVAEIAQKHITRIKAMIESGDAEMRAAFDEFLRDLRGNLNDTITAEDAIEMLAQHSITRPVFETLFEGHSFVSQNPVSRAMQSILDRIDEARIDKESGELEQFYASVRRRAKGITDPAAKQQLIVQLYDRFFYRAFPRTTKRMGVVYTPVEIIDFILCSVDETLQREFGQTLGSEGVHIIDPFTGTGTFITRLLQSGFITSAELERKYQREIHANEIILLAYYIAAINIETAFQGLVDADAYRPFEGICLTDTFQMYEAGDLVDRIMPDNSERRARQRKLDIKVIVGNPPYVVGEDDANSDDARVSYPSLDGRIRDTYAARTGAQNKNGLYNSYIRAIRWASDRLGADGGVVAFVTNGGFLDGNASAGVRRSLVEEFSDLRIFDLRGNQRTSGERSRREGGKIFDAGSRAPIAISILTKNPTKPAAGAIHYHDIGDYLSRQQKLATIRAFGSADGIEREGGWTQIVPDEHGDWINQRDLSFDAFIKIGDKGTAPALFATHSNGVKTQRDAWVVNSSRRELERNVARLVGAYEAVVEQVKLATEADGRAQIAWNNDSRQIAWTSALRQDAERQKALDFDESRCIVSTYRPFTSQWLYFDRRLNERVYRIPSFFPTAEHRTRTICLSAVGHKGQFSAIMVDRVPSLHTGDMAGSQCFPLRYFGKTEAGDDDHYGDLIEADREPEWQEHDGITDAGLAHFQAAYPGQAITKKDVFYYVYGLLHSPDYRSSYDDNLKKELPRIPAVASFEDFTAFATAGRALADLHVGFEEVDPFGVTYEQGDLRLATVDDPERFFRVEKMRFAGKRGAEDRSRIIYNANLTLTGVPLDAYRYVVNGKSAIEHVIERQGVSVDKYDPDRKSGSGIINDANRFAIETMGDPAYPLLLLRRVIAVSVETVRIVEALPPLRLG